MVNKKCVQYSQNLPKLHFFCIDTKWETRNQNGRIKDQSTGQMVDFFLFCSKSNSTETSCKYNSNLEHRYMITLDKFQNMKVFKYNKSKNKWNKIDG